MTKEQQIKAIAELDGWTEVGSHKPFGFSFFCLSGKHNKDNYDFHPLKDYLQSRDAIVSVIEKQGIAVMEGVLMQLWNIFDKTISHGTHFYGFSELRKQTLIMFATPAQLAEALLRATGKWKE